MDILLDGGLNLGDPLTIDDRESSIAINADFRQDGIIRSRDGRNRVYTGQGTTLMGSADGSFFSVGSDVYRDGTALGESITNPLMTGRMALYNVTTEAFFISLLDSNKKVEGTTVYNWGISPPTVAPVISIGSGTGLTGAYKIKYTYIRKVDGTLIAESNPSPESNSITLTNDDLYFTVTTSEDPQVTHIRIYRTLPNGVDYFIDTTINIVPMSYTYLWESEYNTITPNVVYNLIDDPYTYTQAWEEDITADSNGGYTFTQSWEAVDAGVKGATTVADTALGTLLETDNDVPPTNITAISSSGGYNRLFLGVGNKIYFTKSLRPESVPALYYVEVGVPSYPIQALVEWGGLLYAFTKEGVFYLQGTSPATFYPVRTMASRGLYAKKGFIVTDMGIIYVAYDGLYAFNGQSEVKITNVKVDALFRGDVINGINPINSNSIHNSWLTSFKGKLFFGYPDANEVYPNKVLVVDLEKKKFSIYDYSLNIKSVYADNNTAKLYAGDVNGNVWQLETGENDYLTSFTFKVRSKELSNIPRAIPKIIRYDIYNPGGNSLSCKVLEQNTVLHTHTITSNKDYKRYFLPPKNVERLSLEIEGSITSRIEVGSIKLD